MSSRRDGCPRELSRGHGVLSCLLPLSKGVFRLENRGVLAAAAPGPWGQRRELRPASGGPGPRGVTDQAESQARA